MEEPELRLRPLLPVEVKPYRKLFPWGVEELQVMTLAEFKKKWEG